MGTGRAEMGTGRAAAVLRGFSTDSPGIAKFPPRFSTLRPLSLCPFAGPGHTWMQVGGGRIRGGDVPRLLPTSLQGSDPADPGHGGSCSWVAPARHCPSRSAGRKLGVPHVS